MAGLADLSNAAKFGITSLVFVTLLTCIYRRDIFLVKDEGAKLGFDRLCTSEDCFNERSRSRIKATREQFFKKKRAVEDDGGGLTTAHGVNVTTESAQSASQKGNLVYDADEKSKQRLPNTLIIGVKKGGTKALLVFLKAHPQVRACKKEVHFFDNELNYKNGFSWYKSRMPKSESNQITLEKSPRYFVTNRVPRRVYRMSPSTKIILILRDPVKRAISDYVHMKTRKKKGVIKDDIEEILWDSKTGEFNGNAKFIQNSLYSVYLKNWLLYFPHEQIHIVNGDNLIRDPGAELAKVQRFLDINVLIDRKDFIFNPKKRFYCLKNRPAFITAKKSDVICLGRSKGRKHPVISEKTLQAMKEFYRPYNHELYELIGTDFGW